jgi:hypothetical protein
MTCSLLVRLRSEVPDRSPLESEAMIVGLPYPSVVNALLDAGVKMVREPKGRIPLREMFRGNFGVSDKLLLGNSTYERILAASDTLERWKRRYVFSYLYA